jgi:hypothetical protein
METMDYCKRHNIKGAMVSVDVSKAFDSVDHGYMEKVYRFFGFGPQICKWLATIGTGRNAHVLLAIDELSVAFQLEKGHAQGDAPSPLLYNMAAQICIWKVELDQQIKSVYDPVLRTDPDPNPQGVRNPDPGRVQADEVFSNKANRETCKNESFADDANNFTTLSLDSLANLKNILSGFNKLSGLSCNVEKTCIMRIGNLEGEIPDDIKNLGFSFVDEMVLLAYTCMNDNWKYDLHRASNGSILESRSGYLSQEVGTVLTDLVSSYTVFQHKFTQYGNNYDTVPILNNSNFGYGRNQSIKIDATFFGQDLMRTHYQTIRTLAWKNCTINGTMVSIRNFNAHTGIPFTREQYYDLKTGQGKNSLRRGLKA